MKNCNCNIYDTTAAPASPLEHGPGETTTSVLDSGKNKNKNIENIKVEKHVSLNSSSLEPLSPEIPKRVLMRTYLFQKEIHSDVGVENLARGIVHPISALLDSGTNRIFIDQVWAEQIGLPLVKLDVSIPVHNIDGKINLILGWTWLFKHNPEINWQTGVVTLSRCPQECKNLGKPTHVHQTERLEKINAGHIYELRSLEKIGKT
ncbi:hypothetical protein SERLA73DRAFT_71906 [Serpula lacrymans var. lacrymans S7.3]|uniref:Peptidase A2 domain-containing protein n=2 Tax=Serpula lacrymans var. lacrymans TaxID=341189 RepID=F8PTA9_SERL3|nr:uncharacterized protein SERLADRAFT_436370 [Serpula lacrymans var. lacrymans S7.9]EGO00939.1 hypothetical protein SERLA73DRAFT_71906 [Serpula lacrymans var. lacrymans S7.3]EGO26559.1 hypothetical protein SERLADRAFT_436370 [Serpula lacrymans var. lacrymans S7.9]